MWKIEVNVNKTELVLFSKKRRPPTHNIFLQGKNIPWSQETKYLGVILDSKLNWKSHINFTTQKFRDNCRKIYSLSARNSELSRKNKVLIYTSILRPVLTYASSVWAYAAKTHFNRIGRSQNKLLRQITRARWFMRNEDIRNALNISTLKEYIKKLAINFFNSLNEIDNTSIHEIDFYAPDINIRRPRLILI
ncbi:RNA-directed DNA polymerase from mobile element jockey [Araneus ventricosus]|uniref:RNA-directed DNA polymerase from mobile element jockey n=1 Tax=Araneus ventricosus TaxID=182803 RepID=A0A4Y2UGG4_ARAVE|nr:RNA-directed DNA polymerase from mobile element jockey [Araneus ventricosus]